MARRQEGNGFCAKRKRGIRRPAESGSKWSLEGGGTGWGTDGEADERRNTGSKRLDLDNERNSSDKIVFTKEDRDDKWSVLSGCLVWEEKRAEDKTLTRLLQHAGMPPRMGVRLLADRPGHTTRAASCHHRISFFQTCSLINGCS